MNWPIWCDTKRPSGKIIYCLLYIISEHLYILWAVCQEAAGLLSDNRV
uniref:Uncharacterized protein n=1 Tax=Anguilla anguilla TaxID=7936 RepID=A0A0E9U1N5_ANGAN